MVQTNRRAMDKKKMQNQPYQLVSVGKFFPAAVAIWHDLMYLVYETYNDSTSNVHVPGT